MKTQRTTTIITLATTLTWGAGPVFGHGGPSGSPKVCIDVYLEGGSLSPQLLGRPEVLAAAVFEKIGVHLIWHGALPRKVCGSGAGRGNASLVIYIVPRAPASASPDGLASAREYGSEITLYQDRVARFLGDCPADRSVLFAYVLAHELAHVIEGMDRHSDSGILKAHWTGADYTAMRFHRLEFAEEDERLIRRGAAARSIRLEAQTARSAVRRTDVPCPQLPDRLIEVRRAAPLE